MSIVVAVKKNNVCVIASDALTSHGTLKLQTDNKINNCKLIKSKKSCLGLVGWAAMHSAIEHLVINNDELFNFSSRVELFENLLEVHKLLEEKYNIETKEEDDQPVESSQFDALLITKNSIFQIDSYREVNEFSKFWAIGSGSRYALGAMQATYDLIEKAEDIAKIAVETACQFDDGCGLPLFSFSSEEIEG